MLWLWKDGAQDFRVLMLLSKVGMDIHKVKWFKEGKCNKVPKVKEVVHVVTNSMLYMLDKRLKSLPMWLRVC